MGFVRDAARVGTFGLVGLAASKNKKKPLQPQPTMISNRPYERPMSMIGGTRTGG